MADVESLRTPRDALQASRSPKRVQGTTTQEPGIVAEQHVEELTLPRARARERRDSRGLGGHRGRGGRRRKSGGRAQRELTRPH
jgi:hypothetical protein